MCFKKIIFMGTGFPKISKFGYPVPELTDNAQPNFVVLI